MIVVIMQKHFPSSIKKSYALDLQQLIKLIYKLKLPLLAQQNNVSRLNTEDSEYS